MPDKVTAAKNSASGELLDPRPQLLPFDPAELLAIRVRPSQFASMCSVSRQTVSQWARKGWIALGPDGLVDPVAATRQLLKRADPARVRARIFREATATHGQLRARIRALEVELASERERATWSEAAARNGEADAAARRIELFMAALASRFAEGRAAHDAGTLPAWIDELAAVAYYGQDLADYRAALVDEADDGEDGVCPG